MASTAAVIASLDTTVVAEKAIPRQRTVQLCQHVAQALALVTDGRCQRSVQPQRAAGLGRRREGLLDPVRGEHDVVDGHDDIDLLEPLPGRLAD